MEPPHMAETLRCPEIYILGNRENYGISRLIGTEKARRRERTTARGLEISRFRELADRGRVETVFKTCYPDQWQEYKAHMSREGFNPSLPPLSDPDREWSLVLLDFSDTDEFNQACMDVGLEAHAVAMSASHVEQFHQETQTRPVVPMPIRVYRELCSRLPEVHEWWVLGLSHPINHPEWDGCFVPGFTCPSDDDLARSLQYNVKNVADSEWFKKKKHLTETNLEVVLANAMAGCTLVPDPHDQIDGQHVPDDYEYVPEFSQEELQQQAERDENNRNSPNQMEVESSGDEDVVVESITYHPGLGTTGGYTRSTSTEMPRMGQPSKKQTFCAAQNLGLRLNTASWPAYLPVPTRTPTPPERSVIFEDNSQRRVRFEDSSQGAVPKRHRGPDPQERLLFSEVLDRSSPLLTAKEPLCPDALKHRIYYAVGLGERKLPQDCENVLCGLTGSAAFPYEAYDKLTTPVYDVQTMAQSILAHGWDYNHGALFNLSKVRYFNMVMFANFGRKEADDVMVIICAEKEIIPSIYKGGQCVVAVLPYGDEEWKTLELKNKALMKSRRLDRAAAFTMLIVRSPNGVIYRQQCNYEGKGSYFGQALPGPFKKIFMSTRIRKICHDKNAVEAAMAVLGGYLNSWIRGDNLVNLAFPQFNSAGTNPKKMSLKVGFAYGRLVGMLSARQRGDKFANWKKDLASKELSWNYSGDDHQKAPPFMADVHMNLLVTVYDALVDRMAVKCLQLKGLGGEADVIRIRHDLMDPLLNKDSCMEFAAGSVNSRDKFRFCTYDWLMKTPNP
jgi:hypothetical protein